jgi:hypothetical protein
VGPRSGVETVEKRKIFVRSEAFTAVTMKIVVFWDVALCRSCVNTTIFSLHQELNPNSWAIQPIPILALYSVHYINKFGLMYTSTLLTNSGY